MVVHEPHPCHQCRSVSFDNGKQCVITTDLDPEADPLKLKMAVGRPPTPDPYREEVSVTTPKDNAESSRPPSTASQTSPRAHSARIGRVGSETRDLMMRLKPKCAGEAVKDGAADDLPHEGGEGRAEDAAKLQMVADELMSDGGGSIGTE
ncbi:uncharacterized protein LOC142774482 [Rhipicephalus microplus]|uniref:uncharacterized protein LOC142774482 n=1 Tax=Rhipicephalus microplus TaxID=6941 RepID=UPI003F6CA578